MMPTEKELLDINETLAELGMSRSSLYKLMRTDVIKPLPAPPGLIKPGRLKFRRSDVEALLRRDTA